MGEEGEGEEKVAVLFERGGKRRESERGIIIFIRGRKCPWDVTG